MSNNPQVKRVVLIRASHWMEADSIKNYLAQNGIEAFVPNRTSSGSLAGEADLRLGGVSAVSAGFNVSVGEDQLDEAKRLYEEWSRDVRKSEFSKNPEPLGAEDYLRYFGRSALFSVALPGVMHIWALWHLINYLKNGGSLTNGKFLMSCIVFVLTGLVSGWALYVTWF